MRRVGGGGGATGAGSGALLAERSSSSGSDASRSSDSDGSSERSNDGAGSSISIGGSGAAVAGAPAPRGSVSSPPICERTNCSLVRCCAFCGSRWISFSSTLEASSKRILDMCASARLFIDARMFVSSLSRV
jgi:hypothetical protein